MIDIFQIFMDKDAINDIEMDGVFIGANYVYEMLSATNSGYFALQAVHSTIRLHYVQSTGHYAVHVLSDTLANGFYQYFVTLNSMIYQIFKKFSHHFLIPNNFIAILQF